VEPSSPEGAQLIVRAEDFFYIGILVSINLFVILFLLSTYAFGMMAVKPE
jgi:hypothetical protein